MVIFNSYVLDPDNFGLHFIFPLIISHDSSSSYSGISRGIGSGSHIRQYKAWVHSEIHDWRGIFLVIHGECCSFIMIFQSDIHKLGYFINKL